MPIIFLLLLAIPIAELYVIVQVADAIGILETLALLILISVAGAYLLKQQGMATWARLQETLARGQVPTREVTDGALILFGGALLLTPGFLSDCVGLVLLFPPTRAIVKSASRRLFARWAERRFVPPGGRRVYYETTVTRSRPRGPDSSHPTSSQHLESGEDDSPDRG
jgi:UPF0716 family protein affecting phage T7 exclusion